MRVEFQEELDAARGGLPGEGRARRSASLRGAVDALRTQDVELCDEVIAFDDEVDDRYLALEKQIEIVLARQTPVATDLRLVLAVLHSSLHLERMGDHCVTIAKLTKLSAISARADAVSRASWTWASAARRWSRSSLDAFAARDVERARALIELDELIDRANRRVFDEVLGYGTTPRRSSGACA